MKILGIDPGATTGWCLYDTNARCVISAGHFAEDDDVNEVVPDPEVVVIERPKGYGPTFPQLVDAGIVFGKLHERWKNRIGGDQVHELLRLEVCRRLKAATLGQIPVRDDATVWAALLELHGGKAAGEKPTKTRPGGPLGFVSGHSRAALAVAFAYTLPPA